MKNRTTDSTRHAALVATVIDELRSLREARAATRRLERDLSTYTTKAQIDELYTMLDRYDDKDTEQIRAILAKRAMRVA